MTDPSRPVDAAGVVTAAASLGITVPLGSAGWLLAYLDAVLALNEQINLTAIRDRDAAVVLHVLDSLAFALTGLQPQHVLDLGSGNGFPGVAVAALHQRASVVLLDRTGKKVRAIGTCLLTARVPGIETMHGDAAQLPALHRELRAAFDVVTARAVGAADAIAALAAPLLRRGGHLVLWVDADAAIPDPIELFTPVRTIDYDLPAPAARHRRLSIWRRS
ncbi:MAG: class I SAM-dependent methyltransferase [Planctomycetes bacterium]|nr:class I SAM-dependent methyltransferase [Planctomycetota bacterium]